MKKKITLENLICLFILLCPILDIVSFLFRNYFNVTFSPSTLLRPIIPIICFIILFFKEKNKKQKIIISFIYLIYSIIHLIIFQKLHNGSSYGNIKNEFQYIINYSFLIINLYLFFKLIKDKQKINKIIFIILIIYIFSLFFSIITKTSTTTYLEGIGYKGYFHMGIRTTLPIKVFKNMKCCQIYYFTPVGKIDKTYSGSMQNLDKKVLGSQMYKKIGSVKND